MSRYQKGKTNLDFTEARGSEWQWHHLGHMQVCISLQTDNHASTPPLVFYRPDALPATQPTVSKHWRHFQRRLGYITTILLRIISGPHVQEIDATLATYLHWGQCSRAKWLECEFVARWVLRILAVCEITTVSVTEDCTGWAKKTGLFFRLDNFVMVSPRKACSMSKFSKFYWEKGTKLAFQWV